MRFENEHVIFWFEGGCLMATYKDEIVTGDIAREVVRFRTEISKGQSFLCVVYANKVLKITKEARDYFASDEGVEGVIAAAIVIDSLFQATLINFFLKVSSPKIPSKLFTTKVKAQLWLSEFIKVN